MRVARLWRGGPRALIAQLQLVGETHGDGEGLRVVDLDVEAKGRLQASGEELYFLDLRECAGAGKQSLKPVLVLDDRARAPARTSSPSGLERNGGPKRVLSSSVKRLHGGVPSSC